MARSRYFLVLNVFLVSLSIFLGHAAIAASACYQTEHNQKTRAVFASNVEYQTEVQRWIAIPQPAVGTLELIKAYAMFRLERERAKALGRDKVSHCYLGCAIGLATSPKVTDYVGWLKEYRDLTDCKLSTHFEDADYVATMKGARLGARDRKDCAIKCRDEFAKRRRAQVR